MKSKENKLTADEFKRFVTEGKVKTADEILSPKRGEGNYYNCVDYDDAIAAMIEYRNQPPCKEVFIEKDAVKEPPEEDGEYFVTYMNDVGRQFNGTMIYSFECGRWDIQKGFKVISYLVKQSQPVQGYSEEQMGAAYNAGIDEGFERVSAIDNNVKRHYVEFKQFLQSLK